MSTLKRTYTMPAQLVRDLEVEADRRIDVCNLKGKRLTGSVVRDMICISVKYGIALKDIKQLPPDRFAQLCREIH